MSGRYSYFRSRIFSKRWSSSWRSAEVIPDLDPFGCSFSRPLVAPSTDWACVIADLLRAVQLMPLLGVQLVVGVASPVNDHNVWKWSPIPESRRPQHGRIITDAAVSFRGPSVACDGSASATQAAASNVQVPRCNLEVRAPNLEVLGSNFQVPRRNFQVPPFHFQVPASNFQVPRSNLQVPPPHLQVPASNLQVGTWNLLIGWPNSDHPREVSAEIGKGWLSPCCGRGCPGSPVEGPGSRPR